MKDDDLTKIAEILTAHTRQIEDLKNVLVEQALPGAFVSKFAGVVGVIGKEMGRLAKQLPPGRRRERMLRLSDMKKQFFGSDDVIEVPKKVDAFRVRVGLEPVFSVPRKRKRE